MSVSGSCAGVIFNLFEEIYLLTVLTFRVGSYQEKFLPVQLSRRAGPDRLPTAGQSGAE